MCGLSVFVCLFLCVCCQLFVNKRWRKTKARRTSLCSYQPVHHVDGFVVVALPLDLDWVPDRQQAPAGCNLIRAAACWWHFRRACPAGCDHGDVISLWLVQRRRRGTMRGFDRRGQWRHIVWRPTVDDPASARGVICPAGCYADRVIVSTRLASILSVDKLRVPFLQCTKQSGSWSLYDRYYLNGHVPRACFMYVI